MSYNYSKLRGRIVEKFGTIKAFSDALGTTPQQISPKLNNKIGITKEDIENWSNILDISTNDYGLYFFTK